MEKNAAIIHYCQYQERCHYEVKNKLYELGFNTSQVNEQIAALIEIDLLNEERFSRAFARGRFRLKKWGRVKIKQHLLQRKISDYCIKKAFTEIDDIEYETTLCYLAQKKQEELSKEKNGMVLKGKIYNYLLQKGYEGDIINNWLKENIKTNSR